MLQLTMFKNTKAFSSFSVDNLDSAKSFYTQTLGLDVKEQYGGLSVNIAGSSPLMVYQKDDHKPATFTVLNFPVDDIQRSVDELTSKGVTFEQYDTPDIKTDEKGISKWENGPSMAWFKDPAGNVFGLMQQ